MESVLNLKMMPSLFLGLFSQRHTSLKCKVVASIVVFTALIVLKQNDVKYNPTQNIISAIFNIQNFFAENIEIVDPSIR